MILQERENLKLTCAASGDPKPVENIFTFLKIGFFCFGIVSFDSRWLPGAGRMDRQSLTGNI